ncbi:unnamed protein product [Orchesella dallaii]|uniref:Uncharacterized protein n=1 Tax=Orchesella dallaii TaxID=48710 RepID=A0ABP1RDJ2_9HEXA
MLILVNGTVVRNFKDMIPQTCLAYHVETTNTNSENNISKHNYSSFQNIILFLGDDETIRDNLSFILDYRKSKQLHLNRFKIACVVVFVDVFPNSSLNATVSLLSVPLLAFDEKIIISVNLIEFTNNDLHSFIQILRNASLQYSFQEVDESEPPPLIRSTIMLTTRNVRYIFCYMCAEHSLLSMFMSGFPRNLEDVVSQNKQINGNGHGNPMYLFSTSTGESATANLPICLSEKSLVRPAECYTSHLILKLVRQKLNFSKVEAAEDQQPTAPGVHICIMCSYPNILLLSNSKVYYNALTLIAYKHDLVVYYCSPSTNTKSLAWHTLLTPFDMSIWICLLLSSVAVSLFYRNIKYGFDLWITFLEQSFQAKWSPHLLGAILSLVIYVLDTLYQSYLTSGLTAPLEEKRIQSLDELYNSGYRYAVAPDQIRFVRSIIPKQLQQRKFSSNNATFYSIFVNFTLDINMYVPTDEENYRTLAQKKFFRALPLKMLKKILGIFSGDGKHSKLYDVICSQVEEPLWSQQIEWLVQGHMMTETRQMVETVLATGIQSFHDDLNERSVVFQIMRNFTASGKSPFRNYFHVESLGLLNSSISVAFLLFCYLIGICLVFNIFEHIYKKIDSHM